MLRSIHKHTDKIDQHPQRPVFQNTFSEQSIGDNAAHGNECIDEWKCRSNGKYFWQQMMNVFDNKTKNNCRNDNNKRQ